MSVFWRGGRKDAAKAKEPSARESRICCSPPWRRAKQGPWRHMVSWEGYEQPIHRGVIVCLFNEASDDKAPLQVTTLVAPDVPLQRARAMTHFSRPSDFFPQPEPPRGGEHALARLTPVPSAAAMRPRRKITGNIWLEIDSDFSPVLNIGSELSLPLDNEQTCKISFQ